MLLAPEALVVVSFALEKLLEVGLAVKLALKRGEAAQAAGRHGVTYGRGNAWWGTESQKENVLT